MVHSDLYENVYKNVYTLKNNFDNDSLTTDDLALFCRPNYLSCLLS